MQISQAPRITEMLSGAPQPSAKAGQAAVDASSSAPEEFAAVLRRCPPSMGQNGPAKENSGKENLGKEGVKNPSAAEIPAALANIPNAKLAEDADSEPETAMTLAGEQTDEGAVAGVDLVPAMISAPPSPAALTGDAETPVSAKEAIAGDMQNTAEAALPKADDAGNGGAAGSGDEDHADNPGMAAQQMSIDPQAAAQQAAAAPAAAVNVAAAQIQAAGADVSAPGAAVPGRAGSVLSAKQTAEKPGSARATDAAAPQDTLTDGQPELAAGREIPAVPLKRPQGDVAGQTAGQSGDQALDGAAQGAPASTGTGGNISPLLTAAPAVPVQTGAQPSTAALPPLPLSAPDGGALSEAQQAWAEESSHHIVQGLGGRREASFRLTPGTLGTLDVKIDMDAGTPRIELIVQDDRARQHLAGALDRLTEQLDARLGSASQDQRQTNGGAREQAAQEQAFQERQFSGGSQNRGDRNAPAHEPARTVTTFNTNSREGGRISLLA